MSATLLQSFREIAEACPCRAVKQSAYICCEASEDDSRCCEHCGFPEHETGKPCRWPGHAAITALAREAHLAGRLEQAEKDVVLVEDQGDCPVVHAALHEERDRLRALKEDKHDG